MGIRSTFRKLHSRPQSLSGRECDNSNLQGKSKKVRVIVGSSKQIAGSKGKTNFYCTINMLTFNCGSAKLKRNDASRI